MNRFHLISLVKEFKPSLLFVAKFLGVYILLNVAYGLYIESLGDTADNVTSLVASQSALILNLLGLDTASIPLQSVPKVALLLNGNTVINVYEGCNGINVIITFLSFLIAYSSKSKSLLWFVPTGIILLHLANLGRILALFFVAKNLPNYLYFTHKYLFTGAIYLVVIGLWVGWISRIHPKPAPHQQA